MARMKPASPILCGAGGGGRHAERLLENGNRR